MLVRHLPADAATRRALNDGEPAWDLTEQLLAAAVDAIRGGNWQRGGGRGSKPKPIPRPGMKPTARTLGRSDRPQETVVAYLDQFRPQRLE